MATERVRTLLTEPTDREIVKSHPLLSFINIGQRGRNYNNDDNAYCCAVNAKRFERIEHNTV